MRTMLEEDLGETMSRRLAARLLGVDHKALERWIRSGDLPLVYTPDGRTEVPVATVAELYESVTDSRASGTRNRHHLEPSLAAGRHVVAAAANVVEADELVVIGSQAILGSHPDAPDALLRSLEVDIYPVADPDKADRIDGALGDGSPFHRSFGYYGRGVG